MKGIMESTDAAEGTPVFSDHERHLPLIGPNHQVTMPPLKQSARIASLEYINRDQWYAWGLTVPIMRIASCPPLLRKCRSSAHEDKSLSLASTSNSGNHPLQHTEQQKKNSCVEVASSKDANSCVSSTIPTFLACKKEESSALTLVDTFRASQSEAMAEDVPGVSGQSELRSSITSAVQGSTISKKRKKRRSCWQTLRRKGNKKAKTEKGRKEKRWSGSLRCEVGGEEAGSYLGEELASCTFLPGSQPDTWSEDEVASFTLALYLFDKDFCAIKRFLETKKMKDIVHHYYGKFYGTPAFCRWAGSKNNRNRKCVHGPRILQGWRQDELLRRLLPHVPQNSKDEISEAVKAFNERQLTVDGFVSELKAAVGLEVLVRCVGIGVPKRDLTAVHADPTKHGNHPSVRHDIRAARACSSLSKEEMLDYLTGDFRISKTRAQELFWDAVWPRLLEQGWHSVECEMPGLHGSKSSIAFLRPGVKKIAKGSSEKGVHYFDCVSEVLRAVANDPSLLDTPELTGDDTCEGSENQEDEDVQEWSDDMFETLDMHRLRGPRSRKMEARVKNEEVEFKTSSPSEDHAAHDSSESSSVDIDLNLPLSAISSKPSEIVKGKDTTLRFSASGQTVQNNHLRFVKEEIDLNLPPADLDSNSPVLTTEEVDELKTHLSSPFVKLSSPIRAPGEAEEIVDPKTWGPSPIVMHTFSATSPHRGCTSVIGTINLNDPVPTTEVTILEEIELGVREHSDLDQRGPSQAEIVEEPRSSPGAMNLVAFNSFPVECLRDGPFVLHKAVSCACRFANRCCKCQSRKRSLSYRESPTAVEGVDNGKDFISFPKKRAISLGIPVSLGDLGTPNIVFTVDANVTNLCSWSKLGFPRFQSRSNWRQDWNIRVSPSVLPFRVQEDIFLNRELPKCKVVEVDGEMEALNDAEQQNGEEHVPRSLSTVTPLPGQSGNLKRLRCHFSERKEPVSATYVRSAAQGLPRKFTISYEPGSSKYRLVKAKERCARLSVAEGLSSCLASDYAPATQSFPVQRGDMRGFNESGGLNVEVLDGELQCVKGEEYEHLGYPDRPWETPSGALEMEEDVEDDINHVKPLLRDWKMPCLTLTSPGDSYDSYERPQQLPRSRGIRSCGRSHSLSLPVRNMYNSVDFGVGMRRSGINFQAVAGIAKKVKTDTPYSLRNRELAEHDLLMTLCSMQDQKLEDRATPKVKGKRSSRLRRSNFSSKQFIFEGHVEEVDEGLCVQPCTSQGPWQPTSHLPTIGKIPRSSKFRRRRAGLPCKSSCPTAASVPVVPGPKGSTTSKGQVGYRFPGQSATAEEEATAPLNWPVHDVRFSLRRALSDGSIKTDRQSGRKVSARWNQFPVC